MIYMDPPYGIKYASNFQPEVGRRDVKDRDEDLTREPEMVKAYRDTWTLGVHSYLSYLRDRLLLCKELLADTGSIFVQIGDENLHRVRALMDEVFGTQQFVSHDCLSEDGEALQLDLLRTVAIILLWYAKDTRTKFEITGQLFRRKTDRQVALDTYRSRQMVSRDSISDGRLRRLIRCSDRNGSLCSPD